MAPTCVERLERLKEVEGAAEFVWGVGDWYGRGAAALEESFNSESTAFSMCSLIVKDVANSANKATASRLSYHLPTSGEPLGISSWPSPK
jgi:hypothetical protein